MSLGNTTETDTLNLTFRGIAQAWQTQTNLYLRLYSAVLVRLLRLLKVISLLHRAM